MAAIKIFTASIFAIIGTSQNSPESPFIKGFLASIFAIPT